MGGAFLVEVFNHFSIRPDEAHAAIRKPRLFDPVLARFIFYGEQENWKIAWRQKDFKKEDAGHQDIRIAFNKGIPTRIWRPSGTRITAPAQLAGLEPAIVWNPAQLEGRIQIEMNGGKSWVA
jgi:hypothetical protein